MRRASMHSLLFSAPESLHGYQDFPDCDTNLRQIKIVIKKKSHSENPSGIQYAILKKNLVKRWWIYTSDRRFKCSNLSFIAVTETLSIFAIPPTISL